MSMTDSIIFCPAKQLQFLFLSQCATGYTLNVLAALPAGLPYSPQIHLFGQARSAAGLRQLLAVVRSLQYQPPGSPAAR